MKFWINIFSKSRQKLFSLSMLLKLDKPQFHQYSPRVAQRPDPLGLSISNAFQSSHFMFIVKQLTLIVYYLSTFKVVFLVFIKVVSFTVMWVDWIEENKFSFEAPSFKHKLWNRIWISWLNFKSSRLENISRFVLSKNLYIPSHKMIWLNFKIINLAPLYARFQS